VRPSNSILRRISIICPSFNGITPSFLADNIEAVAVFSRGFQSKNIVIPDDRISLLEDLRRTSGMRPTSWDPHLHQYRHYLSLCIRLAPRTQQRSLSIIDPSGLRPQASAICTILRCLTVDFSKNRMSMLGQCRNPTTSLS
jgi:hypothetical protein